MTAAASDGDAGDPSRRLLFRPRPESRNGRCGVRTSSDPPRLLTAPASYSQSWPPCSRPARARELEPPRLGRLWAWEGGLGRARPACWAAPAPPALAAFPAVLGRAGRAPPPRSPPVPARSPHGRCLRNCLAGPSPGAGAPAWPRESARRAGGREAAARLVRPVRPSS